MMQSLCSLSKVRSLLSEVKDIRSDMSWAKVDSWSKAVVASLRKLEKDFIGFSDVVTPFSAGLAQVHVRGQSVAMYWYIICVWC